ncbi:MAG TPA: hypothetical protein VMW07_01110 [Gallionella sp.]|jgi:hypothetical protein|nr:hypothetical protein [Gallionella sp.]
MSDDNSEIYEDGTTKYPWLGPAFFISVLVALTVFFVWLLGA